MRMILCDAASQPVLRRSRPFCRNDSRREFITGFWWRGGRASLPRPRGRCPRQCTIHGFGVLPELRPWSVRVLISARLFCRLALQVKRKPCMFKGGLAHLDFLLFFFLLATGLDVSSDILFEETGRRGLRMTTFFVFGQQRPELCWLRSGCLRALGALLIVMAEMAHPSTFTPVFFFVCPLTLDSE